jgi:pimeloyl-ACP methyl ester carboxylesterase
VIALDTIGRGLSEWSTDPENEYSVPFLARIATELLDQLHVGSVHWLGTSMGGALGIHLAAGSFQHRIKKLIINDIGPEIPQAAVERIRTYIGKPPSFQTFTEYEQWVRSEGIRFDCHLPC